MTYVDPSEDTPGEEEEEEEEHWGLEEEKGREQMEEEGDALPSLDRSAAPSFVDKRPPASWSPPAWAT